MDNRHCLNTIGKKDEIERIYLLVKIRTKFGNKNGLECSFKNTDIVLYICVYRYVLIIVERWKKRIAKSKKHSKQSEQRFTAC